MSMLLSLCKVTLDFPLLRVLWGTLAVVGHTYCRQMAKNYNWLILDEVVNLAYISETWVDKTGQTGLSQFCLPGYIVQYQPSLDLWEDYFVAVYCDNIKVTRSPSSNNQASCLHLRVGDGGRLNILFNYLSTLRPNCAWSDEGTTPLKVGFGTYCWGKTAYILVGGLQSLSTVHIILMLIHNINMPLTLKLYLNLSSISSLRRLEIVLLYGAIMEWRSTNKLKLNFDKLKFLTVRSILDPENGVLDDLLKSRFVVVLNSASLWQGLSVAKWTRYQFMLLCQPGTSDAAAFTHAIVTSRLDYCKVCYMGLLLKAV